MRSIKSLILKNIDRDVNVAKNIRDEALQIFSSGTRDKACSIS